MKKNEKNIEKKYEVLNPYTNGIEIVVTDTEGIANMVRMGFDVMKVEEVEG